MNAGQKKCGMGKRPSKTGGDKKKKQPPFYASSQSEPTILDTSQDTYYYSTIYVEARSRVLV